MSWLEVMLLVWLAFIIGFLGGVLFAGRRIAQGKEVVASGKAKRLRILNRR